MSLAPASLLPFRSRVIDRDAQMYTGHSEPLLLLAGTTRDMPQRDRRLISSRTQDIMCSPEPEPGSHASPRGSSLVGSLGHRTLR